MRRSICLAILLVIVLLLGAARAEDLAKRYPGKLAWSQQGLSWTCGPEDVWELKSFDLEFGRDFSLSCGKSTVALGVHDDNVLWAVVFPEKPATIRAKGRPGDGELAKSVLVRFPPAELNKLFPAKTVGANGSTWLRAEADRIFRRKLGHKWYTPAGMPTIVQPGFVLIDIETSGEPSRRRFYERDANAGKLEYVAEFESKPLPQEPPIDSASAEKIFHEVWTAFDVEYANFASLPRLQWDKHGQNQRKLLAKVQTRFDLAALLADTLTALEDLHVWVKAGDDWLPGYQRERPLNANYAATMRQLASSSQAGRGVVSGRTTDGIGYLGVHDLGDAELPAHIDTALDSLGDTWAMIIDLRFNGGGDELLARQIAGRFVDRECVYSKNQYRSGPKHEDLGPVLDRTLTPRGPWRYESPVVVMQGQRTLSSAESFALMLAQCPQVTTLGDRTGGSSANPRRMEFDCGITVNLPRWKDMDPSGAPIERVGVKPEVQLKTDPDAFTDAKDPVFEAALARLKALPKADRKPGKREP